MIRGKMGSLFDSYCYGPANITYIRKGDSTLWLSLRDSAGKRSEAIYYGCVYWRLEQEQVGLHLSLVQKVTAEELLRHPDSVTMRALQKNASDVSRLLHEWEAMGLSFYLHMGNRPGVEYLVAAQDMEYQELEYRQDD